MKSNRILILSALILFFIFATGIFVKKYLSRSTSLLLDELAATEEHVNNNQWVEAHNSILKLNSDWDALENKWTIFINHDEIDNITIDMKQLSEYIKSRDKTLTMGSLSSLKHFISHMPEMEKVSIKNIF